MRGFRRTIAVMVACLVAGSVSLPCFASENPFKVACEDAIYGGLAGALVGGAFMAFTDKASDHTDYIVYGAASGVIAGAAYGLISTTTRSLAEVDHGRIKFAIPTIIPCFEKGDRGQVACLFTAQLLRGTF